MFKPPLKPLPIQFQPCHSWRLLPSSLWSLAAIALTSLTLTATAFEYQLTVDNARPQPVDIPIYQGETIPLAFSYKSYGLPATLTNLTSATFYWQAGDMGESWWSKPAEIIIHNSPATPDIIRATWSPTNDIAATYYNFAIRTTAAYGSQYRANGTITMRHSPGFIPATLDNPEILPGLATQIAPYVIPLLPPTDPIGTAASVSNSLAASRVPYTGATAAVDLGTNSLSSGRLKVNTGATLLSIGELQIEDYKLTLIDGDLGYGPKAVAISDNCYIVGNDPSLFLYNRSSTDYLIFNINQSGAYISTTAEKIETETDFIMGNLKINNNLQVGAITNVEQSINAISASTVNFQDCLLYTTPGTNYYFRWSDQNQTYTVTGVPQ